MSPYHVRPARRGEARPLLGIYSESGCGKTLSALYLARGFVGPQGRIVMIETESGRGEAYVETLPGGYDVISMRDEFSPTNYGDAIATAEKAEPGALIIDSGSHEWEAVGGVLHMAAMNQLAGKKGVQVWQVPKMDHQRQFVLRLLATPIPLVILCMRAKYPMQEKKKEGSTEKEWVRSNVLEPIQAENILFELFAHGWIDREHKYRGTKWTLDSLKAVLKDGEPISIETGRRLAEWAKGGQSDAGSPGLDGAHNPVEVGSTPTPATTSIAESADELLIRISAGFKKLEMSHTVQVATWQVHAGDAPFLSPQTDVSALGELLADLRARARKGAA